jgi:O-methyltransferase involved in polyketide biosynthesis
MALFRAMETCYPRERHLFEDRFARSFLRTSLKLVSYIPCIPLIGFFVSWFIDKKWAGVRSSGIARTRLIDDLLIQALQDGITQVVILGVGMIAGLIAYPTWMLLIVRKLF